MLPPTTARCAYTRTLGDSPAALVADADSLGRCVARRERLSSAMAMCEKQHENIFELGYCNRT
jgi:hypothetical protein